MSEEEKTIEEQTETIIDAIENETEDDVREALEINKEDGPLAALGAPLIKAAGDPEPADPNMIHKHLDNFLAKIAGETPVDENVRDSTEYWLKRLADGNGGSTKKIYQHMIGLTLTTSLIYNYAISFSVFTNDSAPYATFNDFLADIGKFERIAPISGILEDVVNDIKYTIQYSYTTNNVTRFVGRSLTNLASIPNMGFSELPYPTSYVDFVFEIN